MKLAWHAPMFHRCRCVRSGTDSYWCLLETNYPKMVPTGEKMQRRWFGGFFYYPSRHQPFLEKLSDTKHEPIG